MSSQNKQEKKLMEERIAKVREVVRNNISSNDIVLALHHFDFDVERTIHAFLQGGYKEILSDWEQTGGSTTKKNRQRKNKSGANKNNSNSTKVVAPAHHSNGYSNENFPTSFGEPNELSNGGASRLPNGKTSQVVTSSSTSHNSANNAANKSSGPFAVSSNLSKKTGPTTTQSNAGSGEEVARFQSLNDASKSKVFGVQVDGLTDYAAEISKFQSVLDSELSLSRENVLRCVQEIKQVLAERERQLCAELLHCRDEANQLFKARRTKLQELIKRAQSAKGSERDNLFKELHSFNALKASDQQVVYTTRFVYDNSKALNSILNFGEVIPINNGASTAPTQNNVKSSSPTKHAQEKQSSKQVVHQKQNGGSVNNSKENGTPNGHFSPGHSSIVSEESSDLSQISPVSSQKTGKTEKNVARVANNGIEIKSDGLSTDQLADIQKRIEETLRSQGIDPSVLTEIGVNTVAPRRRPPPGKNSAEKPRKGSGVSGNNRTGSNNGNGQSKQKVKLSIIE